VIEIAHIALILPDGQIVLQRRDDQAPLGANRLAFFGGHVEPGETQDEAMRRELGEETSLDVTSLDIQPAHQFELIGQNGVVSHFHTYTANIPNADFTVYEGQGAEVHSVEQIFTREDVVSSVIHALTKLGGQ